MESLVSIIRIENDSKLGRVLVGKVSQGTIEKGMKVSVRRNSRGLSASTKIKAIYLRGKPVSSVTAEKINISVKFQLSNVTFKIHKGDVLVGKLTSAESIGFMDKINQPFARTLIKQDIPAINPILLQVPDLVQWRNSSSDSLTISLQGGGAKGAFGVGVLKFFQDTKILTPQKKLHLSSASTGSITSVLLAENGPNTIDKAIEQYTNMHQLEDMFTLRPEVKAILQEENSLKSIVSAIFKEGGVPDFNFSIGDFAWDKVREATSKTLSELTIWNAPFTGFNFLSNIAEEAIDTVKNVKALFAVKQSLATLDPVKNKLLNSQTGIDHNRLEKNIRQKRVTLKIAVTSLTSGATCYINERLELMYPIKGEISDGYDYTNFKHYPIVSIGKETVGRSQSGITSRLGLVQAAITSGAFPMFFEPQTIRFTTPDGEIEEVFNDGGVRENLPIRVLARDKHKDIVAIYCSPIDEVVVESEDVKKYSWMEVMTRTLTNIDSENMRSDISTGNPINASLKGEGDHRVMHIAPTVPTLGLTQIDPLSVKTTIWYGYLRAYDEVFLSEFKHSLGTNYELTKIRLRENSEDIFLCWRALGTLGKNLLRESAYRVPIKPGSKRYRYVGWYRKHGRLTLQDGTKVEMKSLRNEDKIRYLAFNPDALHNYLQQKLTLLNLINVRIDLIKSDPNFKDSFMYGELGFMKKSFFGDWFGVYETLYQMNIAINKRNRTLQIFSKNQFFRPDANPLYMRSIKIYAEKEQKPGRLSNITSSQFQFKRLKEEILGNIERIERQGISFEGSINDRWGVWGNDLLIMFQNSDSAYLAKDRTSFFN